MTTQTEEMSDEERYMRIKSIKDSGYIHPKTGHTALSDEQIERIIELVPEHLRDDVKRSIDQNTEWKIKNMTIGEMVDELRSSKKRERVS